jgi:thioredoxin-like negative regulator of GroEL
MVDVYTDWCHWCKVLDEKTYTDARVIQALSRDFIPVKVNPEKDPAFARRYQVNAYPTILFLDGEGRIVHRLEGFLPPKDFLQMLQKARTKHKAIQQARATLKKKPKDVAAHATLAEFYLQNLDPEKAAPHVDALCTYDPEDKEGRQGKLLLRLGVAYGMSGRYDQAAATFQRVMKHPSCRGQALEAEALLYLGLVHLMQKKFEEGRRYLEQAQKHPKASPEVKRHAAQVLRQMAGRQPSEQ